MNLPWYPEGVQLTGLDLSEELLSVARGRAADLERSVTLVHGNAHGLPFDEASFDTVVCTFGLCSIPDVDTAIGEMHRVLRPGGGLLLADHIASSSRPVRAVQMVGGAAHDSHGGGALSAPAIEAVAWRKDSRSTLWNVSNSASSNA